MKRGSLVGLLFAAWTALFSQQKVAVYTTLPTFVSLDSLQGGYSPAPQGEESVGTIIDEDFQSISDWDVRGSNAYSISGGVLTANKGAFAITSSLVNKCGNMMPDNYRIEFDVVAGSIVSGQESGLGVGMRVPLGWSGGQHNLGIRVGLDSDPTRNGYIYIDYDYNGSVVYARKKSEQRLSTIVAGDTLQHTVTVLCNQISIIVSKRSGITTETISYVYTIKPTIPYSYPYLPTCFRPTINAYGGTHKMTRYNFTILDPKGAVVIVGTSKNKGTSTGTKFSDREGSILQGLVSERIVTFAAPSGTLAGMDTSIFKRYAASKVYLADPHNDLEAYASDSATMESFFDTVYDPKLAEIIGLGYVPGETFFVGSPFPNNHFNAIWFRTILYKRWGHIKGFIIDLWDIGHDKATTYGVLSAMSYDGVHENALANLPKAHLLVEGLKLTRKKQPVINEEKNEFSLIPIWYMPYPEASFTGFTSRKLIYQECLPEGTFSEKDVLEISIEHGTSGGNTAKNLWLSFNPNERIVGNDYSDTTYDILLRSTTTVSQRHPTYRVMYVQTLNNQSIQNKASSALHNLADGSNSALTLNMSAKVCVQLYASQATSTDVTTIRFLGIERKKK